MAPRNVVGANGNLLTLFGQRSSVKLEPNTDDAEEPRADLSATPQTPGKRTGGAQQTEEKPAQNREKGGPTKRQTGQAQAALPETQDSAKPSVGDVVATAPQQPVTTPPQHAPQQPHTTPKKGQASHRIPGCVQTHRTSKSKQTQASKSKQKQAKANKSKQDKQKQAKASKNKPKQSKASQSKQKQARASNSKQNKQQKRKSFGIQ